ncbi:hypothetical protein [Cohnella terricola]|uniref:hypothetical protein n=1 Tax=Cohnella terricola TaxID=1289167 RepID=UPI003CCC850A
MRTIASFVFLLILTRFLGKKQISHITLFNYITGITFGSIAASTAFSMLNCKAMAEFTWI